ncbi:MAG TPA: hypothetical protein VFN67_08845 [Polyangiales bacterium]|nr:hypothetical protein [Polyangiales bacterium]
MPREIDHVELLEAALRERAEQRLLWLRDPRRVQEEGPAFARLLSVEGWESLEQAIRQRRYSARELTHLPEVWAELARERARRSGRDWLGAWLQKEMAIGSTQRLPAVALSPLFEPIQTSTAPSGPTEALRALGAALEPHVLRFLELREQAEYDAETQLAKLSRLMPRPSPAAPDALPPPPEAAAPQQRALVSETATTVAVKVPSVQELAETFLSRTDDARREVVRWLVKHTELPGTESDLARLVVGLRGFALDGLARPDRRFFRLSAGARKLGFERDMNARMHGENAPGLLVPLPVSFALGAPRDVRVLQPDLEYGVLSDLSVAQGLGQGLALALISPALGPLLSRPRGASVSAAMGGLFVQLRAEAEYLRRVDGFERDAAEKAARLAALWLLLRARLTAALTLTWCGAARSKEERIQQLKTAGERALGYEVPVGLLALTLLAEDTSQQQFLGLHWGFELHTLLRERFDHDFYLNPRLSEVLRGAAARGADLDAAGMAAELGAKGSQAVTRLFELLG